jgi:adenylate cyclase
MVHGFMSPGVRTIVNLRRPTCWHLGAPGEWRRSDSLPRGERSEATDTGERCVSVLFADIRGFTTYAENRRPRDLFALLTRYAEALTRVVHDHGGQVADVVGDGMMALFGAPEELAAKERAAVESAREILERVEELADETSVGRRGPLRAGVGIATGEAYVGSIRAGDRAFWSAVGSTTNLAARLQHLTRELQSALAIDSRTWRAAGPAAAALERCPRVAIRGLSEPEDVYVLRLGTT